MKKYILSNFLKRFSRWGRLYSIVSSLKAGNYSLRQEIFYFSSLALVFSIILEIIFPRIILVYFNLNLLFLLVILSGLSTLIKR